jgi:predicted Zn-dependent peptidase
MLYNAKGHLCHIEINKGIDAVSAADVARVACDVLKTEKLNLAVIGPHSDQRKLFSRLKR